MAGNGSAMTRRNLLHGGLACAAAASGTVLKGAQALAAPSTGPDEELAWTPAWALRDMFAQRKISPLEYAQFLMGRIDRHRALGAFITVDGDFLIDQARLASEVPGSELPMLHGLPVSVKDLIYTKGLRTTLGSRLFEDNVPEQDAVAIERVRAAGGIVFAKTNTPEFGLASRTSNLIADEALNPWDTHRTSGGSSGGAAVATAAGLGALAVGTDGGGSIRLPSAFNGTFGLKTSRGRVPNGAGPYASPNSVIGPMTRDVRDAALLLQVMAGFDTRDPFAMKQPPADYLGELDKGVKGLRMAWSADFGRVPPDEPDVVPICHDAARTFRKLGAIYSEPAIRIENPMDPMENPHEYSAADVAKRLRAQVPDYVDSFAWIASQSPERQALLSDYVRNMGKHVNIAAYLATITPEVRQRAIDPLSQLFDRYDLLLSPTITRRAFAINGEEPSSLQYTAYTMIFNNSGYCAASIPAGFYKGMPVGLQIVGRPGDEALVLRAARALEKERPWSRFRPELA
jgi:Asp-tRNA(Asn)/Glu-tRNA(Gln) amidotransferase A subunit family amidase